MEPSTVVFTNRVSYRERLFLRDVTPLNNFREWVIRP